MRLTYTKCIVLFALFNCTYVVGNVNPLRSERAFSQQLLKIIPNFESFKIGFLELLNSISFSIWNVRCDICDKLHRMDRKRLTPIDGVQTRYRVWNNQVGENIIFMIWFNTALGYANARYYRDNAKNRTRKKKKKKKKIFQCIISNSCI